MLRFITYALPVLLLLLALFGFAVELLDFEPRQGSVIRLALFDTPLIPAPVVLGAWLMEASGLLALFLLARGRCGTWWLDGLVAGWLGWIFRGPLLVITIVVAARQPQHPWWTLTFGWWVLYSVCGLSLAYLARHSDLDGSSLDEPEATEASPDDGSAGEHVLADGESAEVEDSPEAEDSPEMEVSPAAGEEDAETPPADQTPSVESAAKPTAEGT